MAHTPRDNRLLPMQAVPADRLLLEDVLQVGSSQVGIKSSGGDLLNAEDTGTITALIFCSSKNNDTITAFENLSGFFSCIN